MLLGLFLNGFDTFGTQILSVRVMQRSLSLPRFRLSFSPHSTRHFFVVVSLSRELVFTFSE